MFHLMRLVLVNAPLPGTYKSDSILILTVSSHTSLPGLLTPYNVSVLVVKHEA